MTRASRWVAPLCSFFDNVFDEEILRVVEEWSNPFNVSETRAASLVFEQLPFASPSKEAMALLQRCGLFNGGTARVQELAVALAKHAYDNSLNRLRDGPFAINAKENDILWKHGGRTDDITVLVGLISNTSPMYSNAGPGHLTSERLLSLPEDVTMEAAESILRDRRS